MNTRAPRAPPSTDRQDGALDGGRDFISNAAGAEGNRHRVRPVPTVPRRYDDAHQAEDRGEADRSPFIANHRRPHRTPDLKLPP